MLTPQQIETIRKRDNITPVAQTSGVDRGAELDAAWGNSSPAEETVKPSKVATVLKSVGNALISSEKAAGENISAAINQQRPSVKKAQQGAFDAQAQADKTYGLVLKKYHELKAAGKDTSALEAIIAENSPQAQELDKEFGKPDMTNDFLPDAAKKTKKQIVGDFAGVALDALTAGTLQKGATSWKLLSAAEKAKLAELGVKSAVDAVTIGEKLGVIAKKTATNAAKGAGVGYSYDVARNLQEGKEGSDIVKPGAGAIIGGALPVLIGGVEATKALVKEGAPRVVNSLIKPLLKDFSYGKNPGQAVADEGIVANDWDDLIAKISERRKQVGEKIGSIQTKLSESAGKGGKPVTVNVSEALAPLDEAMDAAAKANNSALLKRLSNTKRALTDNLTRGLDDMGEHVITSSGKRNLTGATLKEAFSLKTEIGDMTQWTGNPSDDEVVNAALKNIYGNIRESIEKTAADVSPNSLAEIKKLNDTYANLTSAEVAAKYRDKILERQNLVSTPIKAGGIGGLIAAVASGGAAIPTILAGVSIGLLDKALETPAFKTRLASWMAKTSPSVIEQLYTKNPAIRSTLIKLTKEATGE